MARILEVVADGRPGGGTTAVLTLSQMLCRDGHDVHLVSQQHSYALAEAQSQGITSHGLDFSARWRTPWNARRLAALLRTLAPDVVHAHGARAGLALALVRSDGVCSAARRIYTVHGFHYPHKQAIARTLARAAEAACMQQAHWTSFVSQGDLEFARQDGLLRWARSHGTITNAVEVDAALLRTPKRYDVAFMGRLTRPKNPLLLVRILEAMRPALPKLAVIGGGELDAQLQRELAAADLMHCVDLHGECGRRRALELLAQCRVLVLPSLWEGHPIALIEAAHLSIPAVASDIPGCAGVVVPGRTGFLVPGVDAAAYAVRLRQLLADDTLRARMGDEARDEARRRFSTETMLASHLVAYGLAPHVPRALASG